MVLSITDDDFIDDVIGDVIDDVVWSRNRLYILLSRTSYQVSHRSATSLGPVCDQDSVMKFGLDQLQTGLRPASNLSATRIA